MQDPPPQEVVRRVAAYMGAADGAAIARFALMCGAARFELARAVLGSRLVVQPSGNSTDRAWYAALCAYGAQHAAFEDIRARFASYRPTDPPTPPLGRRTTIPTFFWSDISALPTFEESYERADGVAVYGGGRRGTAVARRPEVVVADRLMGSDAARAALGWKRACMVGVEGEYEARAAGYSRWGGGWREILTLSEFLDTSSALVPECTLPIDLVCAWLDMTTNTKLLYCDVYESSVVDTYESSPDTDGSGPDESSGPSVSDSPGATFRSGGSFADLCLRAARTRRPPRSARPTRVALVAIEANRASCVVARGYFCCGRCSDLCGSEEE